MKNAKKILALLLALVMGISLIACGDKPSDDPGKDDPAPKEVDQTLVVGYSAFSSKFSPFFSETAYDQDVQAMTQLGLLNADRTGAIILKGIEGETIKYNGTDYTYYGPANMTITENADGTVTYDVKLREDIKFSDGQPLTINDVIFSMYVLCDPTYDGSSTLFAVPIQGMEAYRAGMEPRMNLILADGPEAYKANDYYTEAQFTEFWAALQTAGEKFCQDIADYVLAEYGEAYGATDFASAVALWGYEASTTAEMWDAMIENYGYDLSDDGINCEVATTSISAFLAEVLGDKMSQYQAGVTTGESAANISGIKKTGEYSMTITTTKVDATAIYQLGVAIAPLHYYGDAAKFDYNNNKFGFDKGDLSTVRAKTTQPVGAGVYKFNKFENGVVYFERNDNYYRGAAKIKYINFQECLADDDKLNGIVTGTIDIGDPSFSNDNIAAIQKANGGDLNGSVITTNTVDNLGYGYLGMSANVINVNKEPASEASKNLRKALATVFSVYRDVSVDSYYGDRASVINYPISNTSWAAPQSTDDGYKVAFSVDVNGKDIYTSDMTAEQKYEAALNAALGFFQAAGYEVKDGKLSKAPAGASLEYTAWIPADGTGDHPSFMLLTEAAKAFEKIGLKLIVKDLSNSSELWTAIESEECGIWCAAWGSTVDPDMYQIYFSGSDTMSAGGSNYEYDINDAELNQLILDARSTTDTAARKVMYKAALDIVIDWAVEVPVYQRQNAILFSTARVDMKTVTPDITTFYGWMAEIENTQMITK